MIEIRLDEDSYRDIQSTLKRLRTQVPRKAISVISKALTQIKKVLVDETANVINLSKSRITEDISVEVSGEIASENLSGFKAAVRSTGKPVGLINFATPKDWAWQTPVPIRVKIYKQGVTTTFRHAFIAPGRGGSHTLVMWQRQKHFGRPYKGRRNYASLPKEYRFPIERLTTIRIQDVQANPEFSANIRSKSAKIILADLDIALDEVING